MLRKEEILERTSNGLAVFKHYLPGNWRIGRNFLNPLYEDSKASCNIYFDRRGGIYKMKDFGNDSYSGDCFFLVGQLKGLDCNRAADFVEILEIIDRDLGLGLASGTPVSVPPATVRRAVPDKPEETSEKPVKPYQFREQKFPLAELVYWQQYGITPELLERYKVCSLREYHSETAEGKPYTYTSSVAEPMYGYKGKQHIKLYRPFSTPRFLYGGSFGENYCFGLEQLPAKGDTLFITGGEKDVLSLAAHGFHAICFNSETAKILSERFGKVLQKRQSMTINQREKSTSISTQMDSLIPTSKISNLTQGMFVGAVADNFDERIEQKIFHCEIVVDNEKVKRETARYVKLPQIIDFTDKDGNDRMQEEIQANYDRIRQEVRQIVEDEITRIKNDPALCHLIKDEEE